MCGNGLWKILPILVVLVRNEGAVLASVVRAIQQPATLATVRPLPTAFKGFVSHFGRPAEP